MDILHLQSSSEVERVDWVVLSESHSLQFSSYLVSWYSPMGHGTHVLLTASHSSPSKHGPEKLHVP